MGFHNKVTLEVIAQVEYYAKCNPQRRISKTLEAGFLSVDPKTYQQIEEGSIPGTARNQAEAYARAPENIKNAAQKLGCTPEEVECDITDIKLDPSGPIIEDFLVENLYIYKKQAI